MPRMPQKNNIDDVLIVLDHSAMSAINRVETKLDKHIADCDHQPSHEQDPVEIGAYFYTFDGSYIPNSIDEEN